MRRAFIIGGSGQIGHAATNTLVDGFVTLTEIATIFPKSSP